MTDAETRGAGVAKSTPRAWRARAWVLTAAMLLVTLFGFHVTSGHNLVAFAVLVSLFVVRLVVVERWRR